MAHLLTDEVRSIDGGNQSDANMTRITEIGNLLDPKGGRTEEQRKIKDSANDDFLPISHMLFPGSGSHQASPITRPARSSLLYTDFESTALFRLSAEKKNPSPRQIPSTDLALPVNFFTHYYIGAYGVPVTV